MPRRLLILRAVVSLAFAVIFVRLVQLEVFQGALNRRLADENRIRVIRRLAPRGDIVDRHGRLLAGSRLAFSVCVVPEELSIAGRSDPAAGLARLLGMPVEEVRQRLSRVERTRAEPIAVWRNASPQAVARLEEQAIYITGVTVLSNAIRDYPHGALAAHVLGYVGEISAEELALQGDGDYRSGDLIGKTGIEKVAEAVLRGVDGGEQIEVEARGRKVRTLGAVPPQPGRKVWLALDLDLQQAAEEALGERTGAVVAMDPNTGEVLALVSHPAFDPNLFSGSLTPGQWSRLTGSARPQQDRAVDSCYPPGSVFKPITAAAALEAGQASLESRYFCGGSLTLGDWQLRCWKRDGHGPIDFLEGFAQSCNVMFATLGRRVGPDKLAAMARRFGLGEKTGIDLPQEASGLVPSPEWKKRRRHQAWYPGDTCQMAIGQGDCLVTPLQVAVEFAAIANGGYLVQPRLLMSLEGEQQAVGDYAKRSITGQQSSARSCGLREDTLAALRRGSEAVVEPGGTAHSIASDRYRIAGKTGTAENPSGPPHAWFAGYAPADDASLVVVVIVEGGGHGATTAAPIARHLFDTALLPADGKPAWSPTAGPPAGTAGPPVQDPEKRGPFGYVARPRRGRHGGPPVAGLATQGRPSGSLFEGQE